MMQLFYREKGSPAYPPLIILHGLWGASDNWLPVAGLLSAGFHVFLPDLRNHGHSPWDKQHDYQTLSEDIIRFIEGLHLPAKPFLAGHSMGGKLAMHLILQRPEIVSKAAILDIAPKAYPLTGQDMHLRLLDFIMKNTLHCYRDRRDIHRLIHEHFPLEEEAGILRKNIRRTPQGFAWKINATALCHHLSNLMSWPAENPSSPVPLPVLFIRGENSSYLSRTDIPVIRSLFPHATFTTIPGASHRLHTDQPQLVAEILRHFMLEEAPISTGTTL